MLPPRMAEQAKDGKPALVAAPADLPWRRWYKTSRWQKLRWLILVRDGFTCRMCDRIEPKTSELVCDHIVPHRGDPALFWGGPFQTLCKPCHDGPKRAAERATLRF